MSIRDTIHDIVNNVGSDVMGSKFVIAIIGLLGGDDDDIIGGDGSNLKGGDQ